MNKTTDNEQLAFAKLERDELARVRAQRDQALADAVSISRMNIKLEAQRDELLAERDTAIQERNEMREQFRSLHAPRARRAVTPQDSEKLPPLRASDSDCSYL